MNKNSMLTVKKELRSTIRDRKSLAMMFVTPLFIPLFIFVMSSFFNNMAQQMDDTSHAVGYNYEMSEEKRGFLQTMGVELSYFSDIQALREAFDNGEIGAYVTFDGTTYTIFSNPYSNESFRAMSEVITSLNIYNNHLAQIYLEENGIDPGNVFNIIQYDVQEVEGTNDLINQLLFLGFSFAIMAIIASAIQAATDSTAGEKERGTLETLLTFPIKSKDLISGKYIACVIACMATAILSGVLLIGTLFAVTNMFDIFEGISFSFSPLSITLSLVLLMGFSLFISGVAVVIASLTKTYKEAQSTLMPLSYIPMIPMFMNMFGVEITEIISIIPIINHTLLLNEILMGNINMLHVGLMFASTIVYVVIAIRYLISQYKSEKILFTN